MKILPAWDVNLDNRSDVLDLIIIGMHFGAHQGQLNYIDEADVNCDGEINVLDMIIVAQHWTG